MNPTQELTVGLWSLDRLTLHRVLDAGADIDVQDEEGRTLLMMAAFAGSLERCTELLQRGASVHIRNYQGKTVWDYMSRFDPIAFYSLWLQYGADVDQYTPERGTALHWACVLNHRDTILFLLAQGADPRLPRLDSDYKGKTAYEMGDGSFWETPKGRRARVRWDTVSIQEVFILASELGIVPIPSYLW